MLSWDVWRFSDGGLGDHSIKKMHQRSVKDSSAIGVFAGSNAGFFFEFFNKIEIVVKSDGFADFRKGHIGCF